MIGVGCNSNPTPVPQPPSIDGAAKHVATLLWEDTQTVTYYGVYRSIGCTDQYLKIATSKITSYEDKGVQPKKMYCYKVNATIKNKTSGFSNVAHVTVP